MKGKFNKNSALITILAVVVLSAGFLASTATASHAIQSIVNTVAGNPKPSCPRPFVFSGRKAQCVPCPSGTAFDKATSTCKAAPTTAQKCTTSTDANGVKTTICVTGTQAIVGGRKASASALVSGKVTILADDTVQGTVKITRPAGPTGCHWTKGGF